jgi:hypothetical protein
MKMTKSGMTNGREFYACEARAGFHPMMPATMNTM